LIALASLVVVTAGWVNWAWPRKLMANVLDVLLPRKATQLRENVRPGQVVHAVLLVCVLAWIWTRYREDLHALVVLLEVAGITLLAAEVWAAQEFETSDRDMSQLEQLMYMYLGRNYRGFWFLYQASQNGTGYADLKYESSRLTNLRAEADAKTWWAELEKIGVPASVKGWEETTKHTAVWRSRRLWAGVAMLTAAALLNLFETKDEVPPPPVDDEITVGLRLDGAQRLPAFVSGSAELTPDIERAICRYRATPSEWESAVAIVVGRHDKTELSARTRAQLGSNASLAEHRGLAIQSALKDPLLCGPGQAFTGEVSVLHLDSPPRHVGSRVSREQLEEDRGAELYLLKATARRVPSGGSGR
jgi:hypothetical protein